MIAGETDEVVAQAPSRIELQIATAASASSRMPLLRLNRLMRAFVASSFGQIGSLANIFGLLDTQRNNRKCLQHDSRQSSPNEFFWCAKIVSE